MAKKELINEQVQDLIKSKIEKEEGKLLPFVEKNLYKLFQAIVNFLITIFTLNNAGKWVSVVTVGVVLSMIWKFLLINAYSIPAMTLVVPYLGSIATIVFGIIGGVKGAQSIAEKIIDSKKGKTDETNNN